MARPLSCYTARLMSSFTVVTFVGRIEQRRRWVSEGRPQRVGVAESPLAASPNYDGQHEQSRANQQQHTRLWHRGRHRVDALAIDDIAAKRAEQGSLGKECKILQRHRTIVEYQREADRLVDCIINECSKFGRAKAG